MKRSNSFSDEKSNENKKQKLSKREDNNIICEEETISLLSIVDTNILQNIFTHLTYGCKYTTRNEEEFKHNLDLLLNFGLSCKLFLSISKQKLFPLILNNINNNLDYKKYLKILFTKKEVEYLNFYKKKDINDIFYESSNRGYFDIINTLIKYGSNLNQPNGSCLRTPLIESVFQGNIKTVKKLIKHQTININQEDWYERTALIRACMHDQEKLVSILLTRKDIDITIKDNRQQTALDYSKENNNQNIVKILENYQKVELDC